ncbi:MAG: hypothetical protein A2X94_04160 [Bdellovibrionales bacterium GWB1_55_8]|nr:MAG: hypothetical protein A2X94_04160 [Bdellovibrionales bacterium GWB1_55_8]
MNTDPASPSPSPSPSVSPNPVPVVSAAAIFNDGFDESPDWQSAESFSPAKNAIWPNTWKDLAGGPSEPPPQKWTSYRAATPKRDGHAKTFVLSSEGARGTAGKGITYNIESINYGTWVGGGLDVYLGNEGHKELYVRFYLKYDPDTFHWGTVVPNFAMQKLIRISRLDVPLTASVSAQKWGSQAEGGHQMPVFFPDVVNNPHYNTAPKYGLHFNYSHRYAPIYLPTDGTSGVDVWSIPLGGVTERTYVLDGKWHSYEFRVLMNGAPDAPNGEWEFWVDGGGDPSRHVKKDGIPWVQDGASVSPGWNWLTVLDNSTIQPDPEHANSVMKLFMDDFVASNHYSGPPPAPISVNAQSTKAGAAQLDWTAGENGAQYLLSGYRIYYGTAADALNQSVTLGTELNHEITGLTSGRLYYFEVTAVNQSTYDLNENESLRSVAASVVVD